MTCYSHVEIIQMQRHNTNLKCSVVIQVWFYGLNNECLLLLSDFSRLKTMRHSWVSVTVHMLPRTTPLLRHWGSETHWECFVTSCMFPWILLSSSFFLLQMNLAQVFVIDHMISYRLVKTNMRMHTTFTLPQNVFLSIDVLILPSCSIAFV